MTRLKSLLLAGGVIVAAIGSRAAEPLPALVATNFGSFPLRSQTSLVNNNPGENSSYSLVGGGNELWGPQDKGLFGFFQTNGNFDVRVRVESLEAVHRYAKSGIMVRESLSSSSRMVSLFATPVGPTELPSDNPVGEDEVEFNFRRGTGDGSNNINLGSPGYPNAWLRLARQGNIVYGLVSRDGTNWTKSASVDTSTWLGGALRPNVLLGLGSSSHDDNRLVRSELRDFSQVTAVGSVQIVSQPANTVGAAGSTATLSVGVGDPVDAEYQWYFEDTPIPGATNATFVTPTLSLGDSPRYSVRVKGRNGEVSSSVATVSVAGISAPEFPQLVFDFDDGETPIGSRVFGTAEVDPAAGLGGSGGLVLTRATNEQNGSFIIEDFNGGVPVTSFTAAFKLKIGPGSAKPADGFSFNFGPGVPNGLLASPQQGAGPGLAVSFDIYDNGDFEAPAIDVFYGVDPSSLPLNYRGNILHRPLPLAELVTARYVEVIVRMNADGKLDLVYDGEVIAHQVQTPFVPVASGRFAFAAYSGGQNAFQAIDDVRIDTAVSGGEAYLSSFAPLGNNNSAQPEIRISIADQTTSLVTNSVVLALNGTTVVPRFAFDPETASTVITYKPPTLLAAGSTNTVSIVWADSAGNQNTNSVSFRVGSYLSLPAAGARAVGAGQDAGFNVRVYQIGANLVPSSAFAESVLSGARGENLADLTLADTEGVFVEPSVTSLIDYNVNSAPLGFSTFPGIPGLSDSRENFAVEAVAYLEFPVAGFHQMGVRSDDGFVLWAGESGSEVKAGSFEGEREPADTIFGFVVPQPGVYRFRLVYYQARGGASVRWFSINPAGEQVLINDTSHPEAVLAFRRASGGSASPQVGISRNAGNIVVSWTGGGVLERKSDLGSGAWQTAATQSPHILPVAGSGSAFFRVRQ